MQFFEKDNQTSQLYFFGQNLVLFLNKNTDEFSRVKKPWLQKILAVNIKKKSDTIVKLLVICIPH